MSSSSSIRKARDACVDWHRGIEEGRIWVALGDLFAKSCASPEIVKTTRSPSSYWDVTVKKPGWETNKEALNHRAPTSVPATAIISSEKPAREAPRGKICLNKCVGPNKNIVQRRLVRRGRGEAGVDSGGRRPQRARKS